MTYLEMAVGAVGIGLFSMTIYYNLKILSHFKEHEEFSLTMFFLDKRGPFAFELLSFAAVIYSFGMLYAALGIPYDKPVLGVFSKGSAFLMFVTLLYFLHHIARITTKQGEKEDV